MSTEDVPPQQQLAQSPPSAVSTTATETNTADMLNCKNVQKSTENTLKLASEAYLNTPPKQKKPRKDYTAAISALSAVTSTNIKVEEGVWTPRDDSQLKEAVITIGDFDKIHRLVTFSQKFTKEEIEERWSQLLYDPLIATVSAAQMAALPMANKRIATPEYMQQNTFASQVSSPPQKSQEDPIKKTIIESKRKKAHTRHLSQSLVKFLENETLDILLDEKIRSQVNDKIVELPECPDELQQSWEKERELNAQQKAQNENAVGTKDGASGTTKEISDKIDKHKDYESLKRSYSTQESISKEIVMKLEKDMEKERERERDPKIIAIIRGHKVRFVMRTKEAIIGRASQGVVVDVDVLEEVSEAPHVSRRQALVKLKHDGNFSIQNIGICTIFINGHPLKSGEKCKLNDYYLIEIEQAKFIFEINRLAWNRIKKYISAAKKLEEKEMAQKARTLQTAAATTTTSSPPPQSVPQESQPQNYTGGGSSSTSPALQQPVPQKID